MNRQELLTVVRAYTPGGSVNNREIMKAVDDYLSVDRKRTRDAVLDEVLGVIGEDEEVPMEYIRTHTGEVIGPMTDDIVTPQLNRLRAELRQSITSIKGEEK